MGAKLLTEWISEFWFMEDFSLKGVSSPFKFSVDERLLREGCIVSVCVRARARSY